MRSARRDLLTLESCHAGHDRKRKRSRQAHRDLRTHRNGGQLPPVPRRRVLSCLLGRARELGVTLDAGYGDRRLETQVRTETVMYGMVANGPAEGTREKRHKKVFYRESSFKLSFRVAPAKA